MTGSSIRARNQSLFLSAIKASVNVLKALIVRERLKVSQQTVWFHHLFLIMLSTLASSSVLKHFVSCRGLGKLWHHQRPLSTRVGHTGSIMGMDEWRTFPVSLKQQIAAFKITSDGVLALVWAEKVLMIRAIVTNRKKECNFISRMKLCSFRPRVKMILLCRESDLLLWYI